MLKLELLISCMYRDNFDIINDSNIKCDALIINQTNCKDQETKNDDSHVYRRIDTLERGLSKSRNMALENSKGDICLICDDDEIFVSELKTIIEEQYTLLPDADIVVFKMSNYPSKLTAKIHEIGFLETLRVSSWQITFKRLSIINSGLRFDEQLGSGTGNGAGEENKFLIDAKRKGLKIYYVPVEIGEVAQVKSQWFDGYTEEYFYQRGQTTRYLLGLFLSFYYGLYFILVNRKKIKKDISLIKALKVLLKGVIDNKLIRGKK